MRYDPERLRVGPRTPLTCVRVFHEPLPVVGDTAKIEFVIEYPVTPLMVAVDGRGIPLAAPWAWDLVSIQRRCNFARAVAGDIFLEDPTHDVGFFFIDCALTALNLPIIPQTMNQVVAIAFAARYPPLFHPSALPPPRFVSKIF